MTTQGPWENEGDAVSLRFVDDHDGTGELFVLARANGFSGASSAWFGLDDLLSFAALLAAMPLQEDPAPSLKGGYFAEPPTAGLAQEHVGIEIRQISFNGQVAVAVHLATPQTVREGPHRQQECRLELYTTYERLRHFGDEIQALDL